MDTEFKKEIIIDNYKNPFNKSGSDELNYEKINSNSESCIDDIDLYIDIEKKRIKDIRFNGEACAISTASTSIMLKNIIGKSVNEALDYVNNFLNMVNEEEYDQDSLGEAIAFDEVYKQSNRKTCVTLPYTGIKKILEKYDV